MFWIGVLYFISAIGSALAPDPYLFSFFRFIGGLGVGASSVAAPTYVSEISSAESRGRLVALYQFNIVFGILIAFISNYLLSGFNGANDWRWMLGVEAVPAFAYTILVLRVPNSPRWLIARKGDESSALDVLNKISSSAQDMLNAIKNDIAQTATAPKVFSKVYTKPLMLAFLLAFFNQLSGINFILYYAPEILAAAGFAASDSLFSSVSIGGVNLLFTLIGVYLIDKLGRRQLMYIGSIGYVLSLSMISYGFFSAASAQFKLAFILTFIASHAIGQGAVIWVFISEIFPNKVRALGQAFGSGTHWVFAAIITMVGTVIIDQFEAWMIFAFFAGFMILQFLFVMFIMPETKGISLEELQRILLNRTEGNEESPESEIKSAVA